MTAGTAGAASAAIGLPTDFLEINVDATGTATGVIT